jgi:MarR family transcriptional regulator, transcriptional regulator for hemolysin
MSRLRPGHPLGLQVTRTAKALSRAFDEALSRSGGSLPVWLVLMSLKGERYGQQGDLAAAVGIEGPTLTHHLNRMEADGMVVRSRDPDNRRVHRVEMTAKGHALFGRLLGAVIEFDRDLRKGFSEQELATLGALLDRLRDNVTAASAAHVKS